MIVNKSGVGSATPSVLIVALAFFLPSKWDMTKSSPALLNWKTGANDGKINITLDLQSLLARNNNEVYLLCFNASNCFCLSLFKILCMDGIADFHVPFAISLTNFENVIILSGLHFMSFGINWKKMSNQDIQDIFFSQADHAQLF